jgi:5-methylcytosine-specific restriction endonuclease McrA
MDTLVLSSAYQPMAHVNWKRAISMWFAGKVEIISVYEDRFIKTVDEIFNVPSIVRFVGGVIKKFKYNKRVKFNRENILLRDEGKCQYCMKKLTKKNFTLDHVIPVSKGGKKVWQNIVACCNSCNQNKGSRTLRETKMKLIKPPVTPKQLIVGMENKFLGAIPKDWRDYIDT